ncbi:hypothetical protein QRX60_19780 [Amycolatopsis mongoliensis]|uniref:Uncharacterized protein n=1 Tax=Amycolatopsis mongoliensis TaxID=715475 RepID=A0A9Y2JZ52_9PSEU|nr:hypothetical protein [Amycolatopsis sp. 4-36]WIY05967.1 hypothetical protein QRX60_19780 [Amycolatopsis sp. 4-36]
MSRPLGLVPHLFVRDVEAALSFYGKAFGAVELSARFCPTARCFSSNWRSATRGCW